MFFRLPSLPAFFFSAFLFQMIGIVALNVLTTVSNSCSTFLDMVRIFSVVSVPDLEKSAAVIFLLQ